MNPSYGATSTFSPMGATAAMGNAMNTISSDANTASSDSAHPSRAAADLSEKEMLQFIVDNVNKVLSRKYSLVEFDGIQGIPLLQVLADIFGRLSPSHQINLEENSLDEATPRLTEFLTKTLGYRVPPLLAENFFDGFANAERTIIYPSLYWVLSNMPQNEKRVYLSRFLQRLDVPDSIRAQDEDVRTLYQQYEHLRTVFVQTHRRVEALRANHADPAEARRKFAALEKEQDRLKEYIRAAEKKLSGVPEREALVNASKALRAALEDEARLMEKKVEQQQAFISSKERSTEMHNRLQNLRRDAADGRVDVIVRRMRDEMQTNKMILEDQLPKELEQKRCENEEFNRLLSEPLDMQVLALENQQLVDVVNKLQQEVRDRQTPGEDGSTIATIKQQVSRVTKRKEEVLDQLTSLQADNNRTLNDIRDRENRIEQLREAHHMLKRDDFRNFSNQVRSKKAMIEGMQTRLAELRVEWGVLTFTESVLKSQFSSLDAEIGDLEGKLGLRGYSLTVETLSKLTREKNVIEEMKGKTLDELSGVVTEFTRSIRERRTKLAPLINELRTVRQTAAEVDQDWLEKKAQYEYQEGVLTEDTSKMEREVQTLREEAMMNESMFHRLRAQRAMLDAQMSRLHAERECSALITGHAEESAATATTKDKEAATDPVQCMHCGKAQPTRGLLLRHMQAEHGVAVLAEAAFEQAIEDVQEHLRVMQVRQREIHDGYESSVQQVEWFNNLKRILEAKLQSLHNESPREGDVLESDIQQAMCGEGNGVDMLVLTNN